MLCWGCPSQALGSREPGTLATHRLGFVLQAPTRTKAKGTEKAVLPRTDASCSNSFSRPLLARNWLPIHYLLFTILTGRGEAV